MKAQAAKTILWSYRPGTSDDRDPEVRAALDLAANDPVLARWLEEHQATERIVRGRLRTLQPPPGLKEQILSERRAAFSLWPMPRRLVLACGASLFLVLAGGLGLWLRPQVEERFATFRSRMVSTALRGYAMDLKTPDPAAVRQFLTRQQAHGDWREPPGLAAQPLLGCAILPWQGRPAAMICYGTGTQPELWLFVVATDAIPDPPPGSKTHAARVNRLNTISWSTDGKTYVLAGTLEVAELLALSERAG